MNKMLYFTEQQNRLLGQVVKKTGLSMSSVVREALEKFAQEHGVGCD
ncbi:MAG: ribbon-helix-helix domain-containing protein [Candidatus Syntropharchaeales archaeon]